MNSEILKALKPQTVREFMEIHYQITKLTNPQKFSKDFCEYTSFLETRSEVGSVILNKFSFEQFLLSKKIKVISLPLIVCTGIILKRGKRAMKNILNKFLVFIFIGIILTSCSSTGESIQVTNEMNTVISDFILDYNKDKYYETEKQFESHKIYGAEEVNGIVEVYIYSLYLGFNRSTRDREQSGGSFPVLIKMKNENGSYSVIDYKEPENGDMYVDSIKEMFPKKYAYQAIQDTRSVDKLEKEIKKKVAVWLEETN